MTLYLILNGDNNNKERPIASRNGKILPSVPVVSCPDNAKKIVVTGTTKKPELVRIDILNNVHAVIDHKATDNSVVIVDRTNQHTGAWEDEEQTVWGVNEQTFLVMYRNDKSKAAGVVIPSNKNPGKLPNVIMTGVTLPMMKRLAEEL